MKNKASHQPCWCNNSFHIYILRTAMYAAWGSQAKESPPPIWRAKKYQGYIMEKYKKPSLFGNTTSASQPSTAVHRWGKATVLQRSHRNLSRHWEACGQKISAKSMAGWRAQTQRQPVCLNSEHCTPGSKKWPLHLGVRRQRSTEDTSSQGWTSNMGGFTAEC